jgi:UPF0716 protein FxsA
MRRLWLIIAVLVIVPIIEISTLIAVGKVIGAPLTLLLMLCTSALGAWLLRHEGARAWRAFQAEIAAGRPPGNAATDGLLVLIGGIFMLVPGFVSDVIGLFFILPVTRRLARVLVLRAAEGRMSSSTSFALFGPRQVHVSYGAPRRSDDGGEPIDGEIIDH